MSSADKMDLVTSSVGGIELLVDVTSVDTCSHSSCNLSPVASLSNAELRKHTRYDSRVALLNSFCVSSRKPIKSLFGFAFSCFGRLGNEAHSLLKKLTDFLSEKKLCVVDSSEWIHRIVFSIFKGLNRFITSLNRNIFTTVKDGHVL
ncbi:hypothetical protein RCL1_004617 [Eukaryota sp. TZLM3-RCL]